MPRINWIKVLGFRSFGSVSQRLDFGSPLSVIWGSNSQGKTSLAEAMEFLLTGSTVRREFMASATREFSDCLRNAHLQAGAEVSVEAEIVGADQVARTVKRRLTSDYTATAACTSELTIDGSLAQNLSGLGVRLSHPPLAAPILMQHTLRFVLSAKPQERTDYFKALLEIADLEQVRVAVDRARPGTGVPADPTLQKLDRFTNRPEISKAFKRLRESEPTRTTVKEALGVAVHELLLGADVADKPLEDRAEVLKRVLVEKRRASFPVDGFHRGAVGNRDQPEESTWTELHDFAKHVATADKEAARLFQLFAQLLQVPAVSGAAHPIDCPVCETPRGLTPARVEAIRVQVRASEEYRESHRKAVAVLQALSALVDQVARGVKRSTPACSWWDAGARTQRGFDEKAMLEILGDGGREKIEAWKVEDAELAKVLTTLSQQGGDLRARLVKLRVDDLKGEDVDGIRAGFVTLETAARAVDLVLNRSLPRHDELRKALEEEVGRRTKTEGWKEIVDLVEAREQLLTSLVAAKARQKVAADWDRAILDLDVAIAAVFDAKFGDLGDEITRWWKLLRPDESTSFEGVRRAGTGRRFVDLKAGLSSSVGSVAKVRDAVAVFSDSQLNCLGLAAFLARSVREQVGFVVLDDPVPASDRDHRAMFLHRVLEELVKSGFHVVLLTHDDDTWKDVQERYKHLNLDTYTLCLNDAARGTEAKNTGDTFEVMLDRARPFIRNADSEIRKIGAERLRDAAERFCKVTLVRDRQAKGESTVSLSDYDGYNLGQLQSKLDPLLTKDAAHPGKMRTLTRHLNPGNHDDQVPAAGDLAICLGDLEAFKRDYH